MGITNEVPNSLLVAVEYSDLSLVALRQAIAMTNYDCVSTLHVVHVAKQSAVSQRDVQKGELQVWLSDALTNCGSWPTSLNIRAHLVHGAPADSIVQLASDLSVDTVIVATHGRTGVERLVIGSVSELVVRNCGCPVLVMRRKDHRHSVPQIAPPCPQCVEVRHQSAGLHAWCEHHEERHGRRHTYYSPRHSSWVTQRISI